MQAYNVTAVRAACDATARAIAAEAALERANVQIEALKSELDAAGRVIALVRERADLADKIARELGNMTFVSSHG
jgi:hypothetical protein